MYGCSLLLLYVQSSVSDREERRRDRWRKGMRVGWKEGGLDGRREGWKGGTASLYVLI